MQCKLMFAVSKDTILNLCSSLFTLNRCKVTYVCCEIWQICYVAHVTESFPSVSVFFQMQKPATCLREKVVWLNHLYSELLYLDVFLKTLACGTTVGLGLFSKDQVEIHVHNTVLYITRFSTGHRHSTNAFYISSSSSHHISEKNSQRKDLRNITGCSEAMLYSS